MLIKNLFQELKIEYQQINNNSIDFFINFLKSIKNYNKLLKWSNNNLVLQTQNYYYKIYQFPYSNVFSGRIRKQLANIYKEQYNLDWQIQTYYQKQYIFQIQQREKLKLINEKDLSFNDLLLNWKKIHIELQKKLKLSRFCKVLKLNQNFNDVNQLILLRDQNNTYNDYCVKDNQIFLIDDSDFMILMLDKDYNILQKKFDIIDFSMIEENLVLTKLHYSPLYNLESLKKENIKKWFICDKRFLKPNTNNLQFQKQNNTDIFKIISKND